MKRYPPSVVASEADLDRLSSLFPDSGGASMVESKLLHFLLKGEREVKWEGVIMEKKR